jgi:transcriptional regulator with XRE-family HTH domain
MDIKSQVKNSHTNTLLFERIRLARKTAGMTQEALAQKLEIAYPTLNKYEKGRRIPDARLLNRMAAILDCDPGWLLSGEGEMIRPDQKKVLRPFKQCAINDHGNPPDNVTERILSLLSGMSGPDQREVLHIIEEKTLLRELIEERKKWMKKKQ